LDAKKKSKLRDQLDKIEEDIFLYTQVNKEDKDLDLNSHRQVTRLKEKIKQIDEEVSHILSKEYTNPQNNIEQDYIQLFDKLTNLKIKNYNHTKRATRLVRKRKCVCVCDCV
jgi:ABC-type phosphate transport system auxiliary subunit